MLVELSGQSSAMSGRIVEGFMQFADLLASWLEEAKAEGKLKPGVRSKEVADFNAVRWRAALPPGDYVVEVDGDKIPFLATEGEVLEIKPQ